MSDDTPTQRFDAPLTPSTPPETPSPDDEQRRRNRGLMFALIAVGAAILVVLIVVLIVLLGRDGSPTAATTPTDSPTPSVSASATPTATASSTPSAAASAPAATVAPRPTAAPTANGAPVFTGFSIPDAKCTGSTGTSPITVTYSSVGATAAYFGIGVANAKEAPTEGPLPASGSLTFDYQCSNPTQIWIVTLVDGAGGTTNKSREVHSGAN